MANHTSLSHTITQIRMRIEWHACRARRRSGTPRSRPTATAANSQAISHPHRLHNSLWPLCCLAALNGSTISHRGNPWTRNLQRKEKKRKEKKERDKKKRKNVFLYEDQKWVESWETSKTERGKKQKEKNKMDHFETKLDQKHMCFLPSVVAVDWAVRVWGLGSTINNNKTKRINKFKFLQIL